MARARAIEAAFGAAVVEVAGCRPERFLPNIQPYEFESLLLNELGRHAVTGIEEAVLATGVTACTTGYGSMFRIHPRPTPPRNYRETYPIPAEDTARKRLVDALYEHGVVVFSPGTVTLSTSMGEAEVDALVDAFAAALAKLAREP